LLASLAEGKLAISCIRDSGEHRGMFVSISTLADFGIVILGIADIGEAVIVTDKALSFCSHFLDHLSFKSLSF